MKLGLGLMSAEAAETLAIPDVVESRCVASMLAYPAYDEELGVVVGYMASPPFLGHRRRVYVWMTLRDELEHPLAPGQARPGDAAVAETTEAIAFLDVVDNRGVASMLAL
jgi:hypothetical protein